MNTDDKDPLDSNDDAFGELLRSAGRGPRLSDEARRRIGGQVEAAWRQALRRDSESGESGDAGAAAPAAHATLAGRRRTARSPQAGRQQPQRGRRRTRWIAPAIAASLVALAAVVLLNRPGTAPGPGAAPFAALVAAQGNSLIHRGEQSLQADAGNLPSILVGDRIETSADARVSLLLPGGQSLRLNTATALDVLDTATVRLVSGMVYFDSLPDNDGAGFSVRTDFGIVEHVGTQYVAGIVEGGLIVRVREGAAVVRIGETDGGVRAPVAATGQQLSIDDSGAIDVSAFAVDHADWQWVQTLSQVPFDDPVSVLALLEWIARETGTTVQFETQDAEARAAAVLLNQVRGLSPPDVLTVIRTTTDFAVSESGSTLIVSLR